MRTTSVTSGMQLALADHEDIFDAIRAADPLVADRRQVLCVGIAVGAAVLGVALLRLVRRRPTA